MGANESMIDAETRVPTAPYEKNFSVLGEILPDNYQFDDEKMHMKNAKAWLFIVISKQRPRRYWHRDPDTYGIGGPSRYSMAMLGPPTDVLLPSSMLDSIVPGFSHKGPSVATLERQPRRPLSTGQIYRFSTGQKDSPVHATPIHGADRIFFSVVYV